MSVPSPSENRSQRLREAIDLARTLVIGLPTTAVAAWIVSRGEVPPYGWSAVAVGLVLSLLLAWQAEAALSRKLRTVSSVLASFREGDFSIRARHVRTSRLLSEVLRGLNELGDTLRDRRLGELRVGAPAQSHGPRSA